VFCLEVFIKLHRAEPSSICLDSQIPHFISNSKVPCWEDYCILGCNTMQSGRHILMVVSQCFSNVGTCTSIGTQAIHEEIYYFFNNSNLEMLIAY